MPDEVYCKMVEYIGTDNHEEVNEFILDVLISYIDIHTELEEMSEVKEESYE